MQKMIGGHWFRNSQWPLRIPGIPAHRGACSALRARLAGMFGVAHHDLAAAAHTPTAAAHTPTVYTLHTR